MLTGSTGGQCVPRRTGIDDGLMKSYRNWHIVGMAALLLTLVAASASARPEFLDTFKVTYTNVKSGGTIDIASCNLCHLNGPPKLNPYGLSVREALDKSGATAVNAAVLHSVDSLDSDGDGFSNLEEINADTLPGDPKSHPAGKPASAAKKPDSSESAELSPFDIKSIIFAKHAQHPVIVHLPIGLFIASLLFDLLSRYKKNGALNSAAYYNLILASITGVISVITGIIAWRWKLGGESLVGNLLLHLILGITTSILMLVLWGVRKKGTSQVSDPATTGYLILALITAAVIALTGHVGGIISGVV